MGISSTMSQMLSKKWQVFIVTYSAYAVIYITRKSFSVVKTLVQEDLGLSTYVLGTIDSVFLGTYAVFQVFLPSLSDAFGVRPVLLCSLWAAAFFSLTFSVSYSPEALIYSWLLEGVSHAPVFAVLIKAVSLWFPPSERGKILGLWTTSQQIGAMIATTSATFVSTTFGWRATFTTAAIITAGAAVLVYWTLPEPPSPHNATGVEPTEKSGVELFTMTTKRRKPATNQSPDNATVVSSLAGPPGEGTAGSTFDNRRLNSNDSSFDSTDGTTEDHQINTHQNGHHSGYTTTTSNNPSRHQSINGVPTHSNGSVVPIAYRIGISSSSASSSPPTPTTEPTTPSITTTAASSMELNSSSIQPMKFFDVLRIPNLVACGISYFCVKLVRYALLFWLPYFLITEMGFGTSLAGYSSMLFDVGGVFGAVASGFLADRVFKGKRLTTAAAMCIATSISLFFFAQASLNNSNSRTKAPTLPSLSPSFNHSPSSMNHLHSVFNSTEPLLYPAVSAIHSLQQNDNSQANNHPSNPVDSLQSPFQHSLNSPSDTPSNVSLRFLRRRQPDEVVRLRVHSPTVQHVPKASDHPAHFVGTLVLMTLVGFFVAGPDSILGAASAGEICERSGNPSAQLALSTATGIVNGLGAFGGVAQGYLTAMISETWGWSTLFLVLCGASLCSVAALWRCIIEDWTSPHSTGAVSGSSGIRYAPIMTAPSKKDDKTID